MLKLLTLTSINSKVPLAEIRTDGQKVDWIVDNQELEGLIGDDFKALEDYVGKNKSLKLEDSTGPVQNIRSFSLSTGDTASITDDGKTALLNGKLLSEGQKNSLLAMIDGQEIKILSEGPSTMVAPKNPADMMPHVNSEASKPADLTKIAEDNYKEQRKKYQGGDVYEDLELEQVKSPILKQLMYLTKYKKFKGNQDADRPW